MAKSIKGLVFKVMRCKFINRWITGPLKPLLLLLPPQQRRRIPFVGQICLPWPISRPLVLTSDGGDPIVSELYWLGPHSYEPETIGLYLRLLQHAQLVLDIGANNGLFTLLAALENPNRAVHAFEPLPRLLHYLEQNIKINHLSNVTVVKSAVTAKDGQIPLYVPRAVAAPTGASTRQGFREAGEVLTVPAISLDSYAAAHHLERIDLIKMDTEGTEDQILAGAQEVLARHRPVIICEVLSGLTEAALQTIFEHTNYRFFFISENGVLPQSTIVGSISDTCRNYLFIPAEKVSSFLPNLTEKYSAG